MLMPCIIDFFRLLTIQIYDNMNIVYKVNDICFIFISTSIE